MSFRVEVYCLGQWQAIGRAFDSERAAYADKAARVERGGAEWHDRIRVVRVS